jgi:hypothetical protein
VTLAAIKKAPKQFVTLALMKQRKKATLALKTKYRRFPRKQYKLHKATLTTMKKPPTKATLVEMKKTKSYSRVDEMDRKATLPTMRK